MDDAVTVRRLAPDDWELLRRLRLAALEDSPLAFGSTLARELGFDEETWRSRCLTSTYLLAERDSEPQGMVAGFFRHPTEDGWHPAAAAPPAGSGPALFEIVSMWVAPPARRQGVGRRLVQEITELGLAAGADEVILWVADGNDPALAAYERCGFELTGNAQGLPHAPERCEHMMRLRREG